MLPGVFEASDSQGGYTDFAARERVPLIATYREPSRWVKLAVMVSCLVQQFASVGLGFGLSIMYPELIDVFDAKRSNAALIQGLYLGLSTGAGIVFTVVIEKLGPGPCIAFGSVVSCIGFFVSSFANSLWIVVGFVGVVSGMGMCFCYLSGFIVVSWVFHKDPGFPLVCLTIGSSIGQFVLPALYEFFITSYTWRGAFILVSAIALQCLPFGLIIHSARDYYVTGNEEDTVTSSKCDKFSSLLSDILVWIILINCLLVALTGNPESWFMVDIMVSRGYPRESGSFLVSLIGFANFIGRITGTIIRFKVKNVPTITHWIYICPLLALAHFLVVYFDDYWLIAIGCVLQGATFGVINSQSPAVMYEAAGLKRYPQGMALVNLMYGFGNLFSNVIGGIIRDTLGVYDVVFYISMATAIYMSCSTMCGTCIIRRRRSRYQNNSQHSRRHTNYDRFQ